MCANRPSRPSQVARPNPTQCTPCPPGHHRRPECPTLLLPSPLPGLPPGTTPAMPSSSSLIQGISISVSDDDEATGKVRVRVRRKLSRASASASARRRRRLLFRTARLGVPLLLAALAVSLLLYESYRLTPSHSSALPPPSFADVGHLSRAARAAGTPRKCKPTLDP